MVHVYRAAVYLASIAAALLFYLLLRRLFGKRTRAIPVVAALLAAAGLSWCTHYVLSRPVLLAKYAPILRIKKQGQRGMNMVYMETEVRACNPDGSDDSLLLAQDFITSRDITWSPDGRRMALSRVRDSKEGMNLYIYDADGGNEVRLTSGPGIARRPSWSPDGSRIVFDFRPGLRQNSTDICMVNADGSGRRTLVSGDRINAYHPVWSPDGASIYVCVKAQRRDDLWVMDADGGNLRQLTFTTDRSETEPAVSPDGRSIAFSVNRREIHLMDADGGGYRPLADEFGQTCRGRDPSWTPDGQRILFAGFGTTKERRYLGEVGADGTGLRQIEVPDGKLLNPVLNPDGTRLAYLRFVKTVVRRVPGAGFGPGGPGLPGGDDL